MEEITKPTDNDDPLVLAETMVAAVRSLVERVEAQNRLIGQLQQQLAQLQNDPWSSRVTYDNVVELIATNEDSAVRDGMRKVFEPLLKKDTVRQLRRDIRRKVKELETADGGDDVRTINNYGVINELGPGGVSIINPKETESWKQLTSTTTA